MCLLIAKTKSLGDAQVEKSNTFFIRPCSDKIIRFEMTILLAVRSRVKEINDLYQCGSTMFDSLQIWSSSARVTGSIAFSVESLAESLDCDLFIEKNLAGIFSVV